jgi:hypothetical protein
MTCLWLSEEAVYLEFFFLPWEDFFFWKIYVFLLHRQVTKAINEGVDVFIESKVVSKDLDDLVHRY